MTDLIIQYKRNKNLNGINKNDVKKIAVALKKKFGVEILKEIVKEEMINGAKKEIEKNSFDFEKISNDFLYSYKSINTIKAYEKALKIFKDYADKKGIHILDFKAKQIDNFLIYLKDIEVSTNSKRLIIAGISKFFSQLVRWEFIEYNYFKGAKIPKYETKRELRIPSDDDIIKLFDILETYKNAKGRGAVKMRNNYFKLKTLLELFIRTGLRVGAIKTIKIKQNNIISGYSKGKKFELRINKELTSKLKKLELSKITELQIQKSIEKLCKRAGTNIFSPHDFRHYFAVEEYKKNKDIYKLKKLLNHSNISITENYLKALNIY